MRSNAEPAIAKASGAVADARAALQQAVAVALETQFAQEEVERAVNDINAVSQARGPRLPDVLGRFVS